MSRAIRTWRPWLVAVFGIAVCGAVGLWLLNPENASLQDFVEYWAAGRANLHGENPYDAETIYRHERLASPELTEAIMMWNPPWTLTIAMPFALLPARLAFVLWLGLSFAFILMCANRLWSYYEGEDCSRWVAWLVTVGFVPTFFALRMGQISPLILVGVVGFLWAIRNGRDGLAGASLALAAVKPHLIYLLAFAVLLWTIETRRWKVIAGSAITLMVGSAIPMFINPDVLSQYVHAMTHQPPQMLSPTFGALLRLALGVDKVWLLYVPVVFGLCWFAAYWMRNRSGWAWDARTPVLLFASLLTTNYGAWPFDLILLLVPIIHVSVLVSTSRHLLPLALIVLFGFDGLALLTMNVHWAAQYCHVWMTPMLLCGYLIIRRHRQTAMAPIPLLASA